MDFIVLTNFAWTPKNMSFCLDHCGHIVMICRWYRPDHKKKIHLMLFHDQIIAKKTYKISFVWVVLGCRIKGNCPHMGPGPTGGVPSVWVFLRDPNPIYAWFGENHGKLRTARFTSATRDWSWHLPSTSFESRTAALLVWHLFLRMLYPLTILSNCLKINWSQDAPFVTYREF